MILCITLATFFLVVVVGCQCKDSFKYANAKNEEILALLKDVSIALKKEPTSEIDVPNSPLKRA